ncbi:hypothetical protein M2A_1351 [Tepidicaulis marinus]|uniref:Uncharacterized protein n=1 Tax=Tepidicaulis marinus TaxID=1333998 RepID=A0A081B9Y4_9HYPH|nr:hypothetical protein M2A_1351 [Tepidicaulis marinus]
MEKSAPPVKAPLKRVPKPLRTFLRVIIAPPFILKVSAPRPSAFKRREMAAMGSKKGKNVPGAGLLQKAQDFSQSGALHPLFAAHDAYITSVGIADYGDKRTT